MAKVADKGTEVGMMKSIGIAAGLLMCMSSVAVAQQAGGGAPMGSVDSAKSTAGQREQNAAYNRLAGDIAPVRKGKAVPAKASDIKAGSALRDVTGVPIGSIEAIEGEEAVVVTADGKVKIPLIGFGKDKIGLLLGMTAAELKAAMSAVKGS